MIKILHTLPDLHIGGVSSLIIKLISNFNHDNFEHHICYFGSNTAQLDNFSKLNINIHRVPYNGIKNIFKTKNEFLNLLSLNNIDIIHNHLFLDRVITSLSYYQHRLPIITTIHTTNNIGQKGGVKEKILIWTEDILSKLTSKKFIAVSDTVREVAISKRLVSKNKIQTIYSGATIPGKVTRDILSKRKIKIISIGRLIDSKGFFDLLEIFNICRENHLNVELGILGDGPLRGGLENFVIEKGLTNYVTFFGFVDNVQDQLRSADIYVSCSYEEGFGLSLVEAMAYSLPVIAYDIPIFREISGVESSIILVDKSNKIEFAQKIKDLINIPERYSERSENVFYRAKNNFSLDVMIKKYFNLYNETYSERSEN